MSYQLEDLTFTNKKAPIKVVNFEAQKQQLTNVYLPNKNDRNFFVRVLRGRERLAHGRFRIDNNELVGGNFVRSKVAWIRPDRWIERLIPPRVILTLSQLFDAEFLRQARIKKSNQYYNYLSFAATKNDLSDLKLREEIDASISHFLSNLTKLEKGLTRNFQEKIEHFNRQQIEKIFGKYYTQIQVLVSEYSSLRLRIVLNNSLLTFFQVLWDQIYLFNDLRNSCPCEYNVSKSSNKNLKTQKRKLKYHQTNYVVKKRLKFLSIRISELRFLIWRQKRLARQIYRQIDLEVNRYDLEYDVSHQQHNRTLRAVNDWEKTIQDLTRTFKKSQADFFHQAIPAEGLRVQRHLVYLIDNYHQKVLTNRIEKGNLKTFNRRKAEYNNSIQSIYQQASERSRNNLKRLNIKFDWYLKSGFKLSSLNIIYLKILIAINLKKENFIFDNIIHLLTKKDFQSLIKTMITINKEYPDLTLINLSGYLNSVTSLDHQVYGINRARNIKLMTAADLVKENRYAVIADLPNSANQLIFKKVEHGLNVDNQNWRTPKTVKNQSDRLFINPFLVQTKPDKDLITQENMLTLIVKHKKQNHFLDPKMALGITKSGQKIFLYNHDNQKLKNEFLIFIPSRAISGLRHKQERHGN